MAYVSYAKQGWVFFVTNLMFSELVTVVCWISGFISMVYQYTHWENYRKQMQEDPDNHAILVWNIVIFQMVILLVFGSLNPLENGLVISMIAFLLMLVWSYVYYKTVRILSRYQGPFSVYKHFLYKRIVLGSFWNLTLRNVSDNSWKTKELRKQFEDINFCCQDCMIRVDSRQQLLSQTNFGCVFFS